jgi:hypothetical protein
VMRGLRRVNLACAVFLVIVASGPGYPPQAAVNHGAVALIVALPAALPAPPLACRRRLVGAVAPLRGIALSAYS